jgi:hypothetical protein
MSGLSNLVSGALDLAKAGLAQVKQAASQAQADKLADDVRNAPDQDRGAALALNLQQIERTSGPQAAAQAFAQFVKADPQAAAEAVAQWERDKTDPPLSMSGYLFDKFSDQDLVQAYSNPDHMNGLIQSGYAELGQADASAIDAYTRALSDQMLSFGSGSPGIQQRVADGIAASGNEALQRSFVTNGLDAINDWVGSSGDVMHADPTASFLSSLGHVAAQSPTVARDVFNYTQANGLGSAERGTQALEVVLQAFATEGTALPSGISPATSLQPSYLEFMDALLGPGAKQGALSPQSALTIFTTVSNSGEVWPTGTTLLEQGDKDGGSRGTAQMAQLFEKYAPQWIDNGSFVWDSVNGGYNFTPSNLIAGQGTGTLNDQLDTAFTNFMNEALFDPNEDGAYRQQLMGSMVELFGGLSAGTVGRSMTPEARGRMVGGFLAIMDKGFDQYSDQLRSDAEAQKAWAEFGVGLAFALVPVPGAQAPKVAGILFSQGSGQAESVVNATIGQLIDAGVDAKIARAAAEAANRGDLLAAFDALGLSPQAQSNLQEYIDFQQGSLNSGNKTLGELFKDILTDDVIVPDKAFNEGITKGWDQVQDR